MAAPIEGDPATIALFLSIGLKESPAKELARNKKKSKILVDVIHEVRRRQFFIENIRCASRAE